MGLNEEYVQGQEGVQQEHRREMCNKGNGVKGVMQCFGNLPNSRRGTAEMVFNGTTLLFRRTGQRETLRRV